MPTQNVADQFVEVLSQSGVQRVYGVVGDSLNPLVDAIRRTPGIEWVHVRNEEAAAFAAAAEAQVTGRLAVCAGSCGPGNTHLIQGLYDAHRSAAPVLAIASHIPSAQIGTGFFQETHPEQLFAECSRLLRTGLAAGADAADRPHRRAARARHPRRLGARAARRRRRPAGGPPHRPAGAARRTGRPAPGRQDGPPTGRRAARRAEGHAVLRRRGPRTRTPR